MSYRVDPADESLVRTALLAALVDGDLPAAYRIATTLLHEGVPFAVVVETVLGPVQHELGRRWARGDLTVADEHAATAASESLVTLLCGEMPGSAGPLVAVVCAEGDPHSLPARVVAGILTLRGFHSLLLGASLPAADLGTYLDRETPLAVALSISLPAALYRAAASVSIAHQHGVPIVVGGRATGTNDHLVRRLGADAWAPSADAAADVLDAWRQATPAPLASPVAVHPECLVIDQHRTALIASAVPPDEAEVGTGLADEVSRLLDVVQGALLLDAPALLTEELASASAIRAGNGAGAEALTRVLGRLVTATGAALPATTALLLAA